MTQKFLVIHCEDSDVEELRQYLQGRQMIACDTLDEVGQLLPSAAVPATNGAEAEADGDSSSAAPGRNGVDELVECILDQNNGHSKTLAARVDLLEQKIIEYSLSRNRQHRKETAAELGISRVTLYNKMKKFGLLD